MRLPDVGNQNECYNLDSHLRGGTLDDMLLHSNNQICCDKTNLPTLPRRYVLQFKIVFTFD